MRQRVRLVFGDMTVSAGNAGGASFCIVAVYSMADTLEV